MRKKHTRVNILRGVGWGTQRGMGKYAKKEINKKRRKRKKEKKKEKKKARHNKQTNK